MRYALLWALTSWLSLLSAAATAAVPRWLILPPSPTLPKAMSSGYAPVDGIRIWYAEFGRGFRAAVY